MNSKISVISFIIILLMVTTITLDCSSGDEGKIPITTSSRQALSLYQKALNLLDRLRIVPAWELLDKALQKDPDFAMAHLYYGLYADNTNILFEHLEKALALSDQVSEGERLIILGTQAGINRQVMKQREYYQKLVQQYPNDERAHQILANHYFAMQDYNQAIGAYRQVIQINPDFSQAYNQLGYSHRFLENFQEAENAFKQYIELIPDDPNPYDSYAELLMKMGEFENSIKSYQKALSIDPHFTASHIGIANNLVFLGRPQEAFDQLNNYLSITRYESEKGETLLALAVIHMFEKNTRAALDALQTYYDLSAKNRELLRMSEVSNYMGNILLNAGDDQAALDKYETALQIIEKSELSEALKENARQMRIYFGARVELARNNPVNANILADNFQKKIEGTGNRPHIYFYHQLLAMIALQEKKYDEALGEFLRSNFQDPLNLFLMAQAYHARGDRAQAMKYYEKAANFNTPNRLNYAFVREKAQNLVRQLKAL